jgi:hypothetical protein
MAGGDAQDEALFERNPRHLLRGEELESVDPLVQRRGAWSRIRKYFRGR